MMFASILAVDPMLDTDDWWSKVLVFVAIKVLVIFVIGLVGTMFMVWFERKIVSGMQNRVGPNKAGPFGILQTLADGTKLFFKEDLLPDKADKWVFRLAPFLAFVPAFLMWSVIPLGGDFCGGNDGTVTWSGEVTRVQLADPPVGILLVFALSSIGVYGIMLAGWASGSKYPLLGSVRATAQMISYEAALGLSLAAVLLMSGTLSTAGIVDVQDGLTNWHLVSTGFIPFIVFLIAMTAELNRPPFDLVEAEQELVGGFNTEYSSIRFALFFLAEFMNVITMSGVLVTLFLGGPQGLFDIPVVPGVDRGHDLVRRQGAVVPVRVRLVPCDAAAPAVRPAHGLRLEAADPGRARLVPRSRSDPARPRPRLEHRRRRGGLPGGARCGIPAVQRGARGQPTQSRTGRGCVLMGYLDGFAVTIRQHRLFGGKQVTTEYSGGRYAAQEGKGQRPDRQRRREDRQARTPARPPRPQPVRGRDGEVHRV